MGHSAMKSKFMKPFQDVSVEAEVGFQISAITFTCDADDQTGPQFHFTQPCGLSEHFIPC